MKAMFLAAAAVVIGGSGAAAQDADIEAGAAYAEQVCAACHAVLAGETYSPLPEATPFQTVANAPGMTEMAEKTFGLPVRTGQALGAEGEVESDGWSNAMAIGLALYAARHSKPRKAKQAGVPVGMWSRMGRVKTWFSEVF